MSPPPPLRRTPSRNGLALVPATIALVAIVAGLAGCHSDPPAVSGLLVATAGRLEVTDEDAGLVAFGGPSDPVVALTAANGRVVAATAVGAFVSSSKADTARPWTALHLPARRVGEPMLMSLSPRGTELAVVGGDLQGEAFELLIVDLDAGTSRRIPVARGLNGPPSWIGPTEIGVVVIKSDGESGMAGIDSRTGVVSNDVLDARVASISADGRHLALDDPRTGDVLVEAVDGSSRAPHGPVARLVGSAGSTVESVSLSSNGMRLAAVRRTDTGAGSIEIFRLIDAGWSLVRSLPLSDDGPVSIAWFP